MAETKTQPTGASIGAYLPARASPEQLADCKAIMAMCKRVTKQQPRMWGRASTATARTRLADLDAKVLETLISGSVADVKRRYPSITDSEAPQ